MHDKKENTIERFENYCMAWSVDSISIEKFEEICELNLWDDYIKSINLAKKVINDLDIQGLYKNIEVSPSFNEEYRNDINYVIMYDAGEAQGLFMSFNIIHNTEEENFSIQIIEYDARYCSKSTDKAYSYNYLYGPFLEYGLFKNQELYERTRMMYSKISNRIKAENNAKC